MGVGLFGVLRAEAKLARKIIGDPAEDPPEDGTGWYGRGRPGPALKVALLGDSTAAGYGVDRVEETPAALFASGIAEHADRRVYLRSFAVVGAQSSDLRAQIEAALPIEPDVAIILIGANDVTHVVRPSQSVANLAEGVRRLRAAGVEVVVGTCPDLGTIKPIAPPLKHVARTWSRRIAAGQTIAVVEEGGRTVSLGSILGPDFAAAPAVLFGPDQFHPSASGYAAMTAAILPSVLKAVGVDADDEAFLEPLRGEGILPIATAAAAAVRTPGTEVDGSDLGRDRGDDRQAGVRRTVRGRWVELRHRRHRSQGAAQGPDQTEHQAEEQPGKPMLHVVDGEQPAVPSPATGRDDHEAVS